MQQQSRAVPSELEPLVNALASALSPVHDSRVASLALLQSWSALPGFYSSLLQVFTGADLQLGTQADSVRLQAVVLFKNGVDKYWRKGCIKYVFSHTISHAPAA